MNNLLKVLVLCVISLNIMGTSLYASKVAPYSKVTNFEATKLLIRQLIRLTIEQGTSPGLKARYYDIDIGWEWFDNPKGKGIIVVHFGYEAWLVKLMGPDVKKPFDYISNINGAAMSVTPQLKKTYTVNYVDIDKYIKIRVNSLDDLNAIKAAVDQQY